MPKEMKTTRIVWGPKGKKKPDCKFTPYRGRKTEGEAEWKFLDTDETTGIIPVTGIVCPDIVTISQGPGPNQRVGRKVMLKSIDIRGQLQLQVALVPTDASDIIRLMVVQDKQANGAAFTVTDVLTTGKWLQHTNLEQEDRFRILCDNTYNMDNPYGPRCENSLPYRINIKLNIPIYYDNTSTTGQIQTQQSNSIAVLLVSEGGVTRHEYACRIRYSDES